MALPALLPMVYPVEFPIIAARHIPNVTKKMGTGIIPVAVSNPAVNRSESPGRKNPTSKPVSAKTTNSKNQNPP